MGLFNNLRGQFLDVIEFVDVSNKILVIKYVRPSGDDEIKQGSKVIVREGQEAIFLSRGKLADILKPGSHTLNSGNLPILSSLKAFPFNFMSPIISDLYFISTKQFIGNKWTTKNPVIRRDKEFDMIRIRAFGTFSFRILDSENFMKEIFGSLGLVLTYHIIDHLSSIVTQTFAEVVATEENSILDIAMNYSEISKIVQKKANEIVSSYGIEFSNLIVENISLPDEVEKLIDEQSGIGMAKRDMDTFVQYQSTRAMRDAAKQKGGLAGLGAGFALGNKMINDLGPSKEQKTKKGRVELLKELKELFDTEILTQEEFESEKKKILDGDY